MERDAGELEPSSAQAEVIQPVGSCVVLEARQGAVPTPPAVIPAGESEMMAWHGI